MQGRRWTNLVTRYVKNECCYLTGRLFGLRSMPGLCGLFYRSSLWSAGDNLLATTGYGYRGGAVGENAEDTTFPSYVAALAL